MLGKGAPRQVEGVQLLRRKENVEPNQIHDVNPSWPHPLWKRKAQQQHADPSSQVCTRLLQGQRDRVAKVMD
jgi:hypothetical protein